MSTAELKNYLVKQIIDIEDESLLEKVKFYVSSLVKGKDVDFWDELSDEDKADIDAGLQDIEEGRTFPHEEVMMEIKTKYKL